MNQEYDVEYRRSRPLQQCVAEDERPREKAKAYGFGSLTLSELFALLIGSGAVGENVVELCQRILNEHDNKLYKIARLSINDLVRRYRGIGEVKAIEILAALELSRRYQLERFDDEYQVTTSKDAYDLLSAKMGALSHEEIWIVMLNRSKHVLGVERISSGGTSLAVGDLKMILKPAIEHLSDSIILAHNHPSDSVRPSMQDNELTKKVAAACRTMDMQLLDHIIVCRGGRYYSYNDNGTL
ncbi:MAG: DNA repair protein RadC [Muribaculaceae bacterium]|nr:DNA repair protein RadC [Muribaculaceae bacterium]